MRKRGHELARTFPGSLRAPWWLWGGAAFGVLGPLLEQCPIVAGGLDRVLYSRTQQVETGSRSELASQGWDWHSMDMSCPPVEGLNRTKSHSPDLSKLSMMTVCGPRPFSGTPQDLESACSSLGVSGLISSLFRI